MNASQPVDAGTGARATRVDLADEFVVSTATGHEHLHEVEQTVLGLLNRTVLP